MPNRQHERRHLPWFDEHQMGGMQMNVNTVAAGRGAAWLTEAFDYFKRSAGPWIGVTMIYVVLYGLSTMVRAGGFVFQIIGPIFAGGLMLGCRSQDEGGSLELKHLFAGFSSQYIGQLVLVGVLYVVALAAVILVAIIVVVVAAGGASLVSALQSGNIAAAAAYPIVMLLMVLIAASLMIPLLMALWFAPALVVLDGRSATEAMGESFRGCTRNWLPFLVYGVVGLVFSILASIPLCLGWLILGPMITVSIYLGYKDIYRAEAAGAA